MVVGEVILGAPVTLMISLCTPLDIPPDNSPPLSIIANTVTE